VQAVTDRLRIGKHVSATRKQQNLNGGSDDAQFGRCAVDGTRAGDCRGMALPGAPSLFRRSVLGVEGKDGRAVVDGVRKSPSGGRMKRDGRALRSDTRPVPSERGVLPAKAPRVAELVPGVPAERPRSAHGECRVQLCTLTHLWSRSDR
jgi:hypothetical protein